MAIPTISHDSTRPYRFRPKTIGRTRSMSAAATFSPWTMSAFSTGPWRPPRWRRPSSAPALRTAIRSGRPTPAAPPPLLAEPGPWWPYGDWPYRPWYPWPVLPGALRFRLPLRVVSADPLRHLDEGPPRGAGHTRCSRPGVPLFPARHTNGPSSHADLNPCLGRPQVSRPVQCPVPDPPLTTPLRSAEFGMRNRNDGVSPT